MENQKKEIEFKDEKAQRKYEYLKRTRNNLSAILFGVE